MCVQGPPNTHFINEIGAAHGSNFSNMIHEAQVPLGGAVHFTHFDVSKASVELLPDVLP